MIILGRDFCVISFGVWLSNFFFLVVLYFAPFILFCAFMRWVIYKCPLFRLHLDYCLGNLKSECNIIYYILMNFLLIKKHMARFKS
jgi:hypothetical protein